MRGKRPSELREVDMDVYIVIASKQRILLGHIMALRQRKHCEESHPYLSMVQFKTHPDE